MSNAINDWITNFDAAIKRYQDATSDQERDAAMTILKSMLHGTEGDALYWITHRSKNTK